MEVFKDKEDGQTPKKIVLDPRLPKIRAKSIIDGHLSKSKLAGEKVEDTKAKVQVPDVPELSKSVKTGMVSNIKMLESTLLSTLETAKHEVEAALFTLDCYISNLPVIKDGGMLTDDVQCRDVSFKDYLSLGKDNSRNATLELLVTDKSKGLFKGKERRASLEIKTEFNFDEKKHDLYRAEYVIPEDRHLPDGVLLSIVKLLTRAVLKENYTRSEEEGFVLGVAQFVGAPKIAYWYMKQKHYMTCADVAKTVKEHILEAEKDLEKLCVQAKKKTDLIYAITKESVEQEFLKSRAEAEVRITKLIDDAKSELSNYRESFVKSLDELRTACEREYQAKHEVLENEKRAVVERYEKKMASLKRREDEFQLRFLRLEEKFNRKEEELEMEYAQKHAKLDQKLTGHREKVDSESGKILQLFDVLFPDVKGIEYGTKVDHDLRLYYAQLMQNDLRECEHLEVHGALTILKSIRSACYSLSKRPNGRDIRWIYAGVRAVMEYVGTYDCNVEDVVKKVAALESSNSFDKKPTVEKFLETAFGYDFDMEKHAKGLHSNKAKTKADLGIK